MLSKRLKIFLFIISNTCSLLQAQDNRTQVIQLNDSTTIMVELMDTVVFSPQHTIQSVEELIYYMQQDTTFYKAFKNLHFTNYNAEHFVTILDNKTSKSIASLQSETKHIYRDNIRWMNVLEEKITGNYWNKKGIPKYYTSELYHSLFYEKDTFYNEKNILSKSYLNPSGNSIERNKAQLKLLLFSPGSKIKGLPLIGNKASIFDADIAKNYQFKMSATTKNGIDCYLFEATPIPGKENKVIYQNFQTWFAQEDMHIVARDYHLKFDHSLYDFDVIIKVLLTQKNDLLVVKDMYYKGNWRVISQGREKAIFQTHLYH